MTFELWSNAQLLDAIDSLMERSERDEALRPELDGQLANIYDAMAEASFRDYFGALDAAITNDIGLSDALDSRAALLHELMAEYGRRIAIAMAASRTSVGPCYQRLASSGFIN